MSADDNAPEQAREVEVVRGLTHQAVRSAAASLARDEDVPQDWGHVVRARHAIEAALPYLDWSQMMPGRCEDPDFVRDDLEDA